MLNGNDVLILAARLLITTLFLIFGWRKLRDYSGTVSQMVQLGVPMPVLAAGVATFMELPVAFAVAVGAFTRPSALLLGFYTLGTALIGHHYWCRKIFYRCVVRYRGGITWVLLGRECNVTSRKVGSECHSLTASGTSEKCNPCPSLPYGTRNRN